MKLDAYDIRILAALQRDGRMTKTRLAEEIHLSPSPCWERLRKLEKAGIIRGYHARVD
ncbi:MAG: Lrp/AsnC family transcriptional regulator, partial [Candidatus Competibacteraceae bacterium]|nr:Lrp/AsnC family transcriptional regulator [Candidatus Competibacteraceae bacterium]